MKHHRINPGVASRLTALLIALAALPGCAQPPAAAPPTVMSASAPGPESDRLAREIQVLVGPAACSSDAQCRTLAVGSKACGGPGGYWAWSIAGTDEARLRALATRQAQAAAEENERAGLLSNCSVTVDPGARCVDKRCVLRSANSGALAR